MSAPVDRGRRLRRFFRKPKGALILVLAAFVVLAAFGSTGTGSVVVVAVVVAMAADATALRIRQRRWVFPDGALLTGLIIAMILSPTTSWPVTAVVALVGIGSKYGFRVHHSNIFNPAALALWFAYAAFHVGQSWWGALAEFRPSEVEPAALAILLATGLLIAARVRRIPAAIAFLGVYFGWLTLAAFFGDPGRVAALFRSSDLHAALFCAFFMVTDPPTSPSPAKAQVIFGAIAGTVSYAASQLVGSVVFLLLGVLLANVWAAWRRATAHRPGPRRREHRFAA